jgi:hypothetical protein
VWLKASTIHGRYAEFSIRDTIEHLTKCLPFCQQLAFDYAEQLVVFIMFMPDLDGCRYTTSGVSAYAAGASKNHERNCGADHLTSLARELHRYDYGH